MTVIHHLAQAAAVILLTELLVMLLLFLGIAGGLAFGLHWVRGKTDWAFEKANGYLALVPRYTHVGTGFVAKPFVLGGGTTARVLVTLEALRRQARAARAARTESASTAITPESADLEVTTVVPASTEATSVLPIVPESTLRS